MSTQIIKQKRLQKPYTPEEDQLIVDILKSHTQNLSQGFKAAAKKLPGRTAAGIGYRYQKHIKNNHKIFLQGNNTSMVLNTKNVRIQREVSLEDAMKVVVNLKPEFQEILRQYLNNI